MDIDGLVDNRNIDLWNNLNKEWEISIVREIRETYSVKAKSGKATICIPIHNVESASFTHELLHIYMKGKGIFVGGGLKLYVMNDGILSKLISDELAEHIGNCLEHIKMLPEFLRMGFKREDFISDYSVNKLSEENLKSLKEHFKTKSIFQQEKFNSSAIDLYIGKYFGVKACPNQTHNYSKALNELKHIDTDLYTLLEKFMADWDNFDYNDTDSVYDDMLLDFVNSLRNWVKGKKIV